MCQLRRLPLESRIVPAPPLGGPLYELTGYAAKYAMAVMRGEFLMASRLASKLMLRGHRPLYG